MIEKCQIQSNKQVARLQREIRFLKLLHHPHIVKVYDVIETAEHIYIIMEYAAGGELFDYIVAHKRVKEKEARSFFRMVLSAVDYCHKNAVIHRDLKPENLLLDERKWIKIIDFGFGNNFTRDGLLDTFCGSPFYAAPEMILGKKYEGPEVDMWSLGVILFALLCGHLPFDDENMKELYKKISSGLYSCPDYLMPNARHLIGRLITVNPKERATLQEVLEHPWVNEGYNSPPPNYLPDRPKIKGPAALSKDLINRLMAFGYKIEDIEKSFDEKADFTKSDPIRCTYFLLAEMLRREELRIGMERNRALLAAAAVQTPIKADISSRHPLEAADSDTTILGSQSSISSNIDSVGEYSLDTRSCAPPPPHPQPRIDNEYPHPAITDIDGQGPNTVSFEPSMQTQSIDVPHQSHLESIPQNITRPAVRPAWQGIQNNMVQRPQQAFLPESHNQLGVVPVGAAAGNVTYPPSPLPPPSSNWDHDSTLISPVPRLAVNTGKRQRGPSGMEGSLPSFSESVSELSLSDRSQLLIERPSTAFIGGRAPTLMADPGASQSRSDRQSASIPISSSSNSKAGEDLRAVSGWFLNMSTTSIKSPGEILSEVLRVLNECRVPHSYDGKFTLVCEADAAIILGAAATTPLSADPSLNSGNVGGSAANYSRSSMVGFQIEVCKIPRMNLYGLHFKRLGGGVWNYKKCCNRLLSLMSL